MEGETGGAESVILTDANMSFATILDKSSSAGGWGAAFFNVASGNYLMSTHGKEATPISVMQPYIVKRYWTRTA